MIMIWGVSFPSSLELSKGTSVPWGTVTGRALGDAHGHMQQLCSLAGHSVLENVLFPALLAHVAAVHTPF